MKVIMSTALLALIAIVGLCGGCKKAAETQNAGITVSQAPAAADLKVTPAAGGETAAPAEDSGAICAGCNLPESECTCDHAAEGAKAGCSDPNCKDCVAKAGTEAAAPAAEKTADGIRLVDATVLDGAPARYAGRIAIHGKVGEVMSDKGMFTLVDLKQMPGCKDGCCPSTNIPLRVPSSDFSGSLPKAEQEVIVVGNLSTTPTGGYQIAVDEVRVGDKAIMKKGAAA